MGQTRRLTSILFLCLAMGCGSDQTDADSTADAGETADTSRTEDTGEVRADADSSDADSTGDAESAPDAYDPASCEPSYESWQRNAKPLVETYCSKCHGTEPQFGAPYPLLDYDDLLAGEPGQRKVDRMVARISDRSMPPPPNAALPHTALDTLVEWATCGQQHPDHGVGLEASEPVWTAPVDPPADTDSFDVTASEFPISVDTIDHYECFVVDAPVDTDRFMRRFEPVIDDGRVLHHLLVSIDRDSTETRDHYPCHGFPPGDGYVYVWAPGQGPIEFDDGGLRISPGDKFVLQIHYNNGAGAQDVRDSSGFRVYHSAPEGTEYGLAQVGSMGIFVPPNSEGRATGNCTVQRDVFIRASWPHMHEIGSAFNTTIDRADGTEETLIDLTGWSFEAQLIYDTPTQLHPGDTLRTTCEFDNPYDHTVTFGEGTGDEMCFNFLYISPPMESPCQ